MGLKQNKKYLSIDGRKISYLEQGKGEHVLLLPGLGCDCTLWRFVVPILTKRYHVISLSLPFYGTLNKLLRQKYDFNTYHEFLDRVIKQLGWRGGFYLSGHSLGSIVGIKYANSHPGRVKKMVLVSSPLTDHKEPTPLLWKLGVEFAMSSRKSQEIIEWVIKNPEIMDHLSQIMFPNRHSHNPRSQGGVDFLKTIPLVAAVGCYNDLFNLNFTSDAEALQTPTTFVYGTKDKELATFRGTALYSRIKQTNIIPVDSYHFIPIDMPEKLAKIIEKTFSI